MNVPVINKKNVRHIDGGAFGEYYKISKNKGIKVNPSEYYFTISEAKSSGTFRRVKKELNVLRAARKRTSLVPKPYTMALLKRVDYDGLITYYVGYIMEHIEGSAVSKINLSFKQEEKLDAARNRLYRVAGISQMDAHGMNVIRTKNKNRRRFVFIDAGGFLLSNYKYNKDSCSWS